jgi:hypothetical protein
MWLMKEVTVVQQSGRNRAFWLGLLVGLGSLAIAVIILWFVGFIDVGGRSESESSNDTNTTNVTNNDPTEEEENNTSNETNNETLEELSNEVNETEEAEEARENPFYVDGVTSKSVDEQANPVNETSSFTKEDDRFYVVLTLGEDVPKDTEIMVEWFEGDDSIGEFSTETSEGQQHAYFFQNNPGRVGEYSAKITIDGQLVDELTFVVE